MLLASGFEPLSFGMRTWNTTLRPSRQLLPPPRYNALALCRVINFPKESLSLFSLWPRTTSKNIDKISQRIPKNNNVGLSNYQHPAPLTLWNMNVTLVVYAFRSSMSTWWVGKTTVPISFLSSHSVINFITRNLWKALVDKWQLIWANLQLHHFIVSCHLNGQYTLTRGLSPNLC